MDLPLRTGIDALPAGRPRFRFDDRYLVPILVTIILLGGHLSIGILESPWQTGLAIGTAIVAEAAFSRVLLGRWPKLSSAYITGISVGILVRSPYFWPYALTSLTSIASKYAIRYRGRHIFNPSNFGVAATLFLAPMTVASLGVQWGNTFWVMMVIWTIGLFVMSRVKRLHVSLTYIAAFIFYAWVRSLITGHAFVTELSPITGPMYQLFVLFMITDPPTTTTTVKRRMLVVFLVATVECGLRLAEVVHAPYYALFMVGPLARVIELRSMKKEDRPAASGPTPEPDLPAASVSTAG